MENLSKMGRIFYGLAIIVMGLLTIYYKDFPYMLIPPKHASLPGFAILVYIFGTMLVLIGGCIVLKKKTGEASLLLGVVMLLVFCFYYVPYEFIATSSYMHFGEWENAEKELALAMGAFIIGGFFAAKNESTLTMILRKAIPFATILFSITMICFGIDHFLFATEVLDYIPSWIPNHLFWIYFAGIALIGSGIAIISKVKVGLIATLLGTMTFIWFIILHIPRIIVSPAIYLGSEVASAFLALAYSGIAFVIAGAPHQRPTHATK